jgi:hypothetical protein
LDSWGADAGLDLKRHLETPFFGGDERMMRNDESSWSTPFPSRLSALMGSWFRNFSGFSSMDSRRSCKRLFDDDISAYNID